MITERLNIIYVNIDELKPAEYNPRKASDKEYDDVRRSIERFGLVDPMIVNGAESRKNIVIGGHLRLKIAKELGFKEVPVVYINIPDIEKEKELNLRLNKNLGSWDWDMLANFDEGMLLDVGFLINELSDAFDVDQQEYEKGDVEGMGLMMDEHWDYIVFLFNNKYDFVRACSLFGVKRKVMYPHGKGKFGVGRILKGDVLFDVLEGKDEKHNNE